MISIEDNSLQAFAIAYKISKDFKDEIVTSDKQFLDLKHKKLTNKNTINSLKLVCGNTVEESIEKMYKEFISYGSNPDYKEQLTMSFALDDLIYFPISFMNDAYADLVTNDLEWFGADTYYLMHSSPVNFNYMLEYITLKESMTESDLLAFIVIGKHEFKISKYDDEDNSRDKSITDRKIVKFFKYINFKELENLYNKFGHHNNIILEDVYKLAKKKGYLNDYS